MTGRTRVTLATLAQVITILTLGLGGLLAYVRSSYVPADEYTRAHAAVIAEVASDRTKAAATTEQLRGDVRAIQVQLAAQSQQLSRIERALESALQAGTTRRRNR